MAGYLVACVQWHDPEAIDRYGAIVVESLRPYQGTYLARGPVSAAMEGERAPQRLAIVEFPTPELAREWFTCDAYLPARKIRQQSATTYWVIIIEGLQQKREVS